MEHDPQAATSPSRSATEGTRTMNYSTIQTTPASRREGTPMGHKKSTNNLVAAAIAFVGLGGGAVSVNADTFSDVVAPDALPPTSFPSIVPTCTADCSITLN